MDRTDTTIDIVILYNFIIQSVREHTSLQWEQTLVVTVGSGTGARRLRRSAAAAALHGLQ